MTKWAAAVKAAPHSGSHTDQQKGFTHLTCDSISNSNGAAACAAGNPAGISGTSTEGFRLTAQRWVQVQGAGLADRVAPRLRVRRLRRNSLQRRRHLRDLRPEPSTTSAVLPPPCTAAPLCSATDTQLTVLDFVASLLSLYYSDCHQGCLLTLAACSTWLTAKLCYQKNM
jgi:hypothetical protein